ncbi:MAG: Hsp20/alpha crystallin family protein [candidate division KSB1 bacterium]|nr:Hsp20/alpha crystallin family protein [candidate division KSB1 bacterium]
MAIVRWRPFFSEMESLRRDMDRLFDSFFRRYPEEEVAATWQPLVDIAETKDDFIVTAEVPGMSKDDVKISLTNNVLTLKGEKKEEKEIKDKNFHRVERCYGSFQRSFTLPTEVQADKVKASYKDGVLKITLPKKEEVKPKEIAVTVE